MVTKKSNKEIYTMEERIKERIKKRIEERIKEMYRRMYERTYQYIGRSKTIKER
jgi:hypothetical protein